MCNHCDKQVGLWNYNHKATFCLLPSPEIQLVGLAYPLVLEENQASTTSLVNLTSSSYHPVVTLKMQNSLSSEI